jgi:hypothetical protein
VLRRFENEAVELFTTNEQGSAGHRPGDSSCRIAATPEGDTLVYSLTLPQSLMVRPVDWRRFAYDHSKVAELLAVCVRDNFLSLRFAPWSEDQRKIAETTLMAALGDLSSIFEVTSVRCENLEGGRLLTTISGSHKNGEVKNYCVGFKMGRS